MKFQQLHLQGSIDNKHLNKGVEQMLSMSSRIRRARAAAKFSQAQLAELTGVKRSAVAQWERADCTSPSVEHLAQIAISTGVRFEWLATGRGPAAPDGREFELAAEIHDFAHDETESRILAYVRRMPERKRQLACMILEALVS
jgi:transcriptional regulator with XRE-family HTH domain